MVQAVQLDRRSGNTPTVWHFPKPRNKRIARDFTSLCPSSPDKKAKIAENAFREELPKKVQSRESVETRTAENAFIEEHQKRAQSQEHRRAENALKEVLELQKKARSQQSEESRELTTTVNAFNEMLPKKARYQETEETYGIEEGDDGVYQKALVQIQGCKGNAEEMIKDSIKQAIKEMTMQRGTITKSVLLPNKVRF
ncbi:hypothetical protein DPSP01_013489 [Paraphaeosphaeria sporulosa]